MAKEVKETARQRRQRTSKFANHVPQHKDAINFDVIGTYQGNSKPQPMSFTNLAAALSRFAKISTGNPALERLVLVEKRVSRDKNDNQSGPAKFYTLLELNRSIQQFANGQRSWWEARA